jgi:hypothetical protein
MISVPSGGLVPYSNPNQSVMNMFGVPNTVSTTVWSEKVEAILESEKYETLKVDELFSKLKSSEVDRGVRKKIEDPTDPHTLC